MSFNTEIAVDGERGDDPARKFRQPYQPKGSRLDSNLQASLLRTSFVECTMLAIVCAIINP